MIPEREETSKKKEADQPQPMYRPQGLAQSFTAGLYGWLQPILFALAVLFVVSTFLGRLIGVDGCSMVPTLHDGDMLLLRSIGYDPAPGDVVVLAEESFRDGSPIVKRVIATAGQRVDIDYDAHTVSVDGKVLDEPYLDPGDPMVAKHEAVNNHLTVPDGHIFVMGDNRNNSTDSRYAEVGMVDERCVIGQAVWSLKPFGRIGG